MAFADSFALGSNVANHSSGNSSSSSMGSSISQTSTDKSYTSISTSNSETGDSTSTTSTEIISTTTTTSTTTTSSSSSQSQNVWRRAIRLNTLGSHSSWTLGNYSAQQILGMLSDLQPTLLQRYVSGSQVPNKLVPVCSSCSPMTAQQFLQSSEDVSNSVIIARISLYEYDAGTLFNSSQSLLNMPINPPIRMLSLDDFDGFIGNHSQATLASLIDQLYAQGWQWIETGGCTDQSLIPNGLTNYASVCFRYPDWQVESGPLNAWKNHTSVLHILATMDFPNDIPYLINATFAGSAQEASIFANVAGNQSALGYTMIYFIAQGGWDSNNVVIKQGPYAGMTVYQEMKLLMQEYN